MKDIMLDNSVFQQIEKDSICRVLRGFPLESLSLEVLRQMQEIALRGKVLVLADLEA